MKPLDFETWYDKYGQDEISEWEAKQDEPTIEETNDELIDMYEGYVGAIGDQAYEQYKDERNEEI